MVRQGVAGLDLSKAKDGHPFPCPALGNWFYGEDSPGPFEDQARLLCKQGDSPRGKQGAKFL